MNILFTFEDNRTNKNLSYYDLKMNQVIYMHQFMMKMEKLYPIEDEKDWDTVQEVLMLM